MLIELAGMTLDDVVLDEGGGLHLINRIPGPGDVGAAADGEVVLEIASATGSPPSIAATTISVDGGQSFVGGVFQAGWDGPGSTTSNPDPQTLRIVIDPQADFVTLSTIVVRVQSADIAATAAIDETYSFVIEDLLVPLLVQAQAIDQLRVSATFNEPVSQAPPNSALDLHTWHLEPIDLPAVSPAVVSAMPDASNVIVLAFAEELSPLRRYRLVAEGVADLFGNVLIRGEAEFVALACPSRPPGRRFDILSFLPRVVRAADASGDQRVLIAAMQEIFDLLLCDIDRFFELVIDPETALEVFVDRMLADMGNPFAFEDLALLEKRRLLLSLVDIYRLKGTAPGMIAAIRFFLGIEVTLDIFNVDQWELGIDELGIGTVLGASALDQPLLYSFRVISDVVLTDAQRFRIAKIVQYMKGIHEHFLGIVEPSTEVIDHWELGLSELGVESLLH